MVEQKHDVALVYNIHQRQVISLTIFCVLKLCLLVRLLLLFCIPLAFYTEMKTNHCDQEWQ